MHYDSATARFVAPGKDRNKLVESVPRHSEIFLPNERGIRPPLKWAGGKRWLVSHVKPMYDSHKRQRLVEPFCGGLAVTLGLLPDRAMVNDINPHAINFYTWLKRGMIIGLEMSNDEITYYRHRESFNRLIEEGRANSRAAAELFYYLNRTGFNGLCRFNKKGFFNVPFGKYKNINYRRDFRDYKYIFQDWHFALGDFELLDITSRDFVYADPPYDVEFTQYSQEGFDWNDQVRLASWLASHRGPVVVSNQATDRIVELYKSFNFKIDILDAPRMISCTGDRSKAQEILAYRNL